MPLPSGDGTGGPPAAAMHADAWLDQYGDALYRYALFRTGDPELAADLVQETLLAALRSEGGFSGKSSVKTWLFAILKHKVLDEVRRRCREREVFAPEPAFDAGVENRFDEDGEWKVSPLEWGTDPANVLSRNEFWEAFRRCLDALPPRCRAAFSLVELNEATTGEACEVLNLTASNVWVILYRARTRLRQCLETNWFGRKGGGGVDAEL